jgi:hypothetical protein
MQVKNSKAVWFELSRGFELAGIFASCMNHLN